MAGSDLARAALIGAAALAVFTDASPYAVYVLAVLVSVVATLFRPAEAALTPSLARTPEELTAANVSASTIESVGTFAGPAIGGLLLAAVGTSVAFLVTGALMLWSALFIAGIRSSGEAKDQPDREAVSIRDELLAGFRTIARERRMRVLVGLFSAQTFVGGMLSVFMVVIALKLLQTGEAGVGFLNSAVGVGGVLGAFAAAALIGRKRLAADFGLGILIWGIPIALIAVWSNQVFVLVMLAIVGLGNTIVDVSGMTLLQRSAPDEVLARVFGVLESLLLLSVGLGAVVAPLLLDWLGTRGALIVGGSLLPLVMIPAWPRLNAIDRMTEVPVERLELLSANPIFAPLPESTLEQLAHGLEEVTAPAEEEILRQGDRGDRFYLVKDGALDVYVDGELVQSLGSGDSFGEIALLRDVPRTATVTARTEVMLYALDRRHFLAAVTGSGPSLSAAEGVIGMRLGVGRAATVRA